MNDNIVHIYVDNLWSGEYDKFFNNENEYSYEKDAETIFVLHIDGFSIMVGRLAKLIRNSATDILNLDLAVLPTLEKLRKDA